MWGTSDFIYLAKKRAKMVSSTLIRAFSVDSVWTGGVEFRSFRHGGAGLASCAVFFLWACFSGGPLGAQVINEVIAQNSTQEPADIACGHPDMIELYNNTNQTVILGRVSLADSYFLSDCPSDVQPQFDSTTAWPFPPNRSTLGRGARLVVFCDGNATQGTCSLHAGFNIENNGSESVVLWGPEEADGTRQVVDRVFLPPLAEDVSYGRSPDGAGGNNVSIEDSPESFTFFLPGETTFGSCTAIAGVCLVPGQSRRHCSGGRNGGGSNLAPRVNRVDQSTNNPAAGEEVELTVRIRDDKIPSPGNIASVEIAYRVRSPAGDFSDEQVVAMDYDSDFGVRADILTPLDLFSLWTGRIPAQVAGTRVEFYFRVEDTEGLSGTRPRNLCHLMDGYGEGVGPCDRELGPAANGCVRDAEDVTCRGGSVKEGEDDDGCGEEGGGITGERYIACNARSTYAVGYTPRAGVAAVLVNEIIASQSNVLTDPSEEPCLPSDACPIGNPDCCRRDEDFVELINTSGQEVDLSECYLSDSFFDPRRWKFPEGSVIPAGARFIVWLDNDGSKCPDPTVSVQNQPCFWECPDPNIASMQLNPPQFHTGFGIDADGDQVFLYDSEANNFGLLHGFDFGQPSEVCGFTDDVLLNPGRDIMTDQSISLVPDGARSGQFAVVDNPTPGTENSGEGCDQAVTFRRGDATGDGGTDITDGVFILNYLFLGTRAPDCMDAADTDDNGNVDLSDAIRVLNFLFLGGVPPLAPGPAACGSDPEDDALADCVYEANCG